MKSPGAEPFETQPEPSIKVLHVQEALIFLHLMKTGGTSLFRLLKPHYPRQHTFHYGSKPGRTLHDFEQLPPDNRDQLKFIHGHLAFGFHHRLNQPCRYITMLRDPISRVISLYYFLYHNPQRYIPEHQRCETLHDFLELNYLDADNYQTRQIAGPLSEQFGFGKCNTTLLNVAKANLAECLSVGITERFDESLLVLRHQLGLNQILYAP
ncbi:MAG: sulfotransferase family 2 domain-containing protein, partial [Cyanobacteria bacterium J06626_14]